MKIKEIFQSVQGEGSYTGCPVVFVRFAGCPVGCSWCDTNYKEGKDMTAEEVSIEVQKLATSGIVVITGGEPTAQLPALRELTKLLHIRGYEVHIETSGYVDLDYDMFDWIVCSPKPNLNYKVPEYVDELKYVVDENFTPDVIPWHKRSLLGNKHRIWLQPCDYGKDNPLTKKCLQKALKLVQENSDLRLGMQAHKVWEVE